jgi:hypothetical protein
VCLIDSDALAATEITGSEIARHGFGFLSRVFGTVKGLFLSEFELLSEREFRVESAPTGGVVNAQYGARSTKRTTM